MVAYKDSVDKGVFNWLEQAAMKVSTEWNNTMIQRLQGGYDLATMALMSPSLRLILNELCTS